MLDKPTLDLLRSCAVAPEPFDAALFVVNGRTGTADVTLSVRGDVLLSVTADGPLFPEGRACFSPQQARELCVAILAVVNLVEDDHA